MKRVSNYFYKNKDVEMIIQSFINNMTMGWSINVAKKKAGISTDYHQELLKNNPAYKQIYLEYLNKNK